MSKTIIICVMFLYVFTNAFSQTITKKPENLINFSYSGQYYLNKYYIHNGNANPPRLSTNNTTGYNIELAYQHTTRWGLIITYGIQYGTQKHDVHAQYNLEQFDPESDSLKGRFYNDRYSMNFKYINQRLMLGYIRPLPQKLFKGWAAEIKAGFGTKVFSAPYVNFTQYDLAYQRSNPSIPTFTTIGFVQARMGNTGGYDKWQLASSRNSFLQTFELYAGVRKDMPTKHLKNISIGLELTRAAYPNHKIGNQIRYVTYDTELNITSQDYYYNKNLSIGLRFGVGLW